LHKRQRGVVLPLRISQNALAFDMPNELFGNIIAQACPVKA
jgi:hypothetical protein